MVNSETFASSRFTPTSLLTSVVTVILYAVFSSKCPAGVNHRIGLLSKDMVSGVYLRLIDKLNLREVKVSKVKSTFDSILDDNESIGYLRAKCISALVLASVQEFIIHQADIIAGNFNSSLIGEIENKTNALEEISTISYNKIYRHPSVLEIEIAGFHVMSQLLEIFVTAVLKNSKSSLDKTVIALIPKQFQKDIYSDSQYLRVMNVIDHISGMTDAYATEMFRKLKGIEI